MIERKVAEYIRTHALLGEGERVLVALSGGADSVALLRLMLALGHPCEAAHCNFHLRGAESDRDQQFVEQLCLTLQVPLHVTHFDTTREADLQGISIEMAARQLRYNWFETLRTQQGINRVAVAHHQDDSIETLLLNLMRGTGINGLQGIRPLNGAIIRPLLCLNRKQVLDYLDQLQQPYVTDSTNLHDEYLRNKIRLNILPLMEEINPAVRNNLLRTAHNLHQAALIYKKGVDQALANALHDDTLHIPTLLDEPAPETLLHEWLAPRGFNPTQVADITRALTATPGRQFLSPTHRLVKDRQHLILTPLTPDEKTKKPVLHITEQAYTPDFIIPREKHIACLDADKLTGELTLRHLKPGDTFVPFGMTGQKKVSDYLTNRKYSLLQKEAQWALCCGENICWLVNERTDNRYRITTQTTRMLIITTQNDKL